MHIRYQAELLAVRAKRGTENTRASIVIQLGVELDRMDEGDRGRLLGYTGEQITMILVATPRPDPMHLPLDEALDQHTNGQPEMMRPLAEERCGGCGYPIGEDPGRRFVTPLAGPPRPMHASCADNYETALDVADDAAAERAPPTTTGDEVTLVLGDDAAAADGEADWKTLTGDPEPAPGETSDVPIGDAPLPNLSEPIGKPIRKRGGGTVRVV